MEIRHLSSESAGAGEPGWADFKRGPPEMNQLAIGASSETA